MIYAGFVKVAAEKPQTGRVKFKVSSATGEANFHWVKGKTHQVGFHWVCYRGVYLLNDPSDLTVLTANGRRP